MPLTLSELMIQILGAGALLIGVLFLTIGFYIAFLRTCDEKTSIRLPVIGYLCKENIGMAFVSTGIVALGFFVSNVFIADKIKEISREREKLLTDAASEMRQRFSGKTQFDGNDRSQIDFLVKFVQRIDPKSGHAFYFAGELSRIERRKQDSWPFFFRYIEMQSILPDGERGGHTVAELCYNRPRGFCPQRTAYIRHLLANDFYDTGKAAPNAAERREFYTRAYCQTELLLKDYPGGFAQFTPTSVIRSEVSTDLKAGGGGEMPSCGA